jgi:hypothetical protein
MVSALRSDSWIEYVEVQLCKWTDAPELRARVGYEDQLARLVAMRTRREARAAVPRHARVMDLKATRGSRTKYRRALNHWWPAVDSPNSQNTVYWTDSLIENLNTRNRPVDLQDVESDWMTDSRDVAGRAPDNAITASPREPLPNVFVSQQIHAINRLLLCDASAAESRDQNSVAVTVVDLVDPADPSLSRVSPGELLST